MAGFVAVRGGTRRARSLGELTPEEIAFLAEEAGMSSTRPPSKRRPRKPKTKLADALKIAKKVGTNVAGATIAPDGSISLTFGERPAKRDGSDELEQWMADYADQAKGH
jgi:hypothetical protein